jgi:thiamine biosynthesis lipoprotein
MNPKVILSIFLLINVYALKAQFVQNADSAFTLAKEKNRDIMLVFSGSDWCVPCMRFDKKILSNPAFKNFADTSLVIVEADFPQSKKLPKQMVEQNEALAEKYNPSGSFPLIVLINAEQKVEAKWKYENENLPEFMALLNKYLL